LSPSEKYCVVARRIGAVAADGESRIDGKTFFRGCPRFVKAAKPRQSDREVEMRRLEIPVDLDRVAQSRNGFFVLAQKDSCDTQIGPPKIGESVPGGIVRVNSILPPSARGWARAVLFLLTNCRRARSDSTPKIAYTYLP
jgi:hypothetical protein